ncbi:MAG: hypothetical protein ACAH07_00240 [Methylophilaceae bacterium]|nr:hypothetical protein [Methyloradius sp.]
MSAILYVYAASMSDALSGGGKAFGRYFEEQGYEFISLNLALPEANNHLVPILSTGEIEFVFSPMAYAADLMATDENGKQINIWTAFNVPFISLNGDTPAYFFDRHVNIAPNFATLYWFQEHYALRKQLPQLQGLIGLFQPCVTDAIPLEEIDFKVKENGKLFFLKNGNDPEALKKLWVNTLSPTISTMLLDLASELESQIHTTLGDNIDSLVMGFFEGKGLDLDNFSQIRLFFDAQLDDYMRRAKSTFMGKVLADFPVVIQGENWGHVDFSGKRCEYIQGGNYYKSREQYKNGLGIIDMSPNTSSAFHDRPTRAYGAHTLCITNEQQCLVDTFGNHEEVSYIFEKESLQSRIEEVLAHPKRYVEMGADMARVFNDKYPKERTVKSLVDLASLIRLGSSPNRIMMQDFFVWPPTRI